MKISLPSNYLSLVSFPPMELPSFAILTGLNGSGKTHLLQALATGKATADIVPSPPDQVRYYDWTNLVPRDQEIFDSHDITAQRKLIHSKVEQPRMKYLQRIIDAAKGAQLPDRVLQSGPIAVLQLTFDQLRDILGNELSALHAKDAIDKATKVASTKLRGALDNDALRDILDSIAASTGLPPIALERKHYYEATVPVWGRAEAFQQSFAQLFVTYRDISLTNQIKLNAVMKTGRTDISALDDKAFVQAHGLPPWTIVNQAIAAAELGFEIDHPDEFTLSPYKPTLTKLATGTEVPFSALSSGEKILMSLALCLYYAEDRRQLSAYPKLLLLDEIDAPLHPSMSRRLLRIILDVLVRKHGISVILATHSVSTAALAPPGSIYVMGPEGAGVSPVTKSEALNVLTVGVPTLAISYEGRRQVFVESPIDAKVYDAVYQVLKCSLVSERSLEFVATGSSSPATGSHANTGCDNVVRIVGELAAAGNTTVFGMLDWDGHRKSTQRVIVLGEGARDGLENVLLDPLLVASVLGRLGDSSSRASLGLREDENYLSFQHMGSDRLQPIVDCVQDAIVGTGAGRIAAGYVGGLTLQLASDYLTCDDHELEEKILVAFPQLKSIARGRAGELMIYIAETVLREQPKFAPTHLREAFAILLDRPAH